MPVYVPGVPPDLAYPVTPWGPHPDLHVSGRYVENYVTATQGEPPGTLIPPQEAAAVDFSEFTGTSPGDSALAGSWDYSRGASPPYSTTISGGASRTPYVLSPFMIDPDDLTFGVVQPDGGILWDPLQTPVEDRPAGYIGAEWLDEPGVPAGTRVILPTDVIVTLSIQGTNNDESTGTPISADNPFLAQHGADVTFVSDTDTTPAGPDYVTAWAALGGTVFHVSETSEVGTTLDLSLIDYLDSMYRALIYAGAPAAQEPGDLSVPTATIAYGQTFAVDAIVWHYVPPPFRWVLDSSPVLRHYPRRGDGRGWGGVARGYPSVAQRGYGGARQP